MTTIARAGDRDHPPSDRDRLAWLLESPEASIPIASAGVRDRLEDRRGSPRLQKATGKRSFRDHLRRWSEDIVTGASITKQTKVQRDRHMIEGVEKRIDGPMRLDGARYTPDELVAMLAARAELRHARLADFGMKPH